ncbi:MAG: prolyl aminopeptidase [Pseudobdellovibrionaceae bacterium]|jgi:proline iminopeptidase|nr:prolyl aminopeptidase [Pseudobdellovibrionaceae bacterium]
MTNTPPLQKASPKSLSYASALHPRPMRDLFPPLTPYSQGFLSVDDTHTIYWEQSGNPDGVPVIVLHGGPGAGATSVHRRFFDPDFYRIIIFDQRGAGRSHPLGSLTNNTLNDILDDTEKLRIHLKIERWHLFGGSWGSTLALSYAQKYPERCISLCLRSIFLMEQYEIDWFMTGMSTIFPEAWDNFIEDRDQTDLLKSYYEDLIGHDDRAAIEAALRWNAYESTCASFYPQKETLVSDDQRFYALAMAKIEAHYFYTQVIEPEDSLLKNIRKIRSIPATIIQGRYDMICPMASANRLHLAWPEADYIIVPDAGHSFLDPTLRTRLIETTENLKNLK